ncbi:PAS domain S-box protein [Melittangium boletus]|uniref:PAS domain S-box protein n=1 Tax=Melittangium boletus TaxID=83453 RepID=UPI003DA4CD9F
MDPRPPAPGASPLDDPPFRARSARPVLLGHAVAMLAVGVIALLFLDATQRLVDTSRELARSLDFINEADHLLYLVKEAETQQRGLLFMREAPDTPPLEESRRHITGSLARLKALAPEDPLQRERLDRLETLVHRELAQLERNLTLTRSGQPDVALASLRTGDGQRLMTELRELEERMDAEEQRRLDTRNTRLERTSWHSRLTVLLGSGFVMAFIGLSWVTVLRDTRTRERERLAHERRRDEQQRLLLAAEGERQRQRYLHVLTQVPAGVGVYQARERRLEFANPMLVKMLGGGDPDARMPAHGRVLLDEVIQSGRGRSGTDRHWVPDPAGPGAGQEFFIDYTLEPILDASGQVEAVLIFAADVTEQARARRSAEEALAHRQRAELALRENEAHLRRTLKASEVGAWEADLRTRRLTWSPHLEVMSGMAHHAFPTTLEAFLTLLHPEDRPRMAERLSRSLGASTEFRLEYRILRAEGGVRWHENRGRVLLDDAGQPTRLAGVVLDITSRKRAEQSQRESEERFRLLMEMLPQLVWMTRPDGTAEYFNPRWYEYTGQTPERALGQGWLQALHPDDVAATHEAMRLALSAGQPYRMEFRLRRAGENTFRWFLAQGLALRDATGAITHGFCACTDIDDQKRGIDALRFISEVSEALTSSLESQATLEQVVRLTVPSLADWCVVDRVDEAGHMQRALVAHADPALALAADVLRRHPPEDKNEHPPARAARLDQTVFVPEVTGALLERITRSEEHLRTTLDLRLLSLVSVPLRARGRTLGVLTFFTTAASGRRYGREDVLRFEQVTHRAALALDNALLYSLAREERARAEDANRLKDEFLATVSHELRTPLTAMIGWLKLLRDGRLPPAKQARALETVDRNAHAQAQLVEDLLDVSRIVSGKLRLDTQVVPLEGVILGAMESVRPAAEAKGMRLHADLGAREALVMGDASRLQQVVWNLVANAVKFSPGGGGVQVRLRAEDAAVALTVQDEGPGIPEAFLPHLFERFRQLDGGTTRQHGGLGLGLAIVRHLVELHGGSVHATNNTPAPGARFTVRLPLAQARAPGATQAALVPPRPPAVLEGRRLLVVDDEEDSREMLKLLLEDHGAHVATAASVAEALAVFDTARPDLLLSDIGMPGEDGYALIARVRARPPAEGGHVTAVALTAYARVEDRTRALDAGFDMHVPKPIAPEELLSVLTTLVALPPRN